MFKAKKHLVGPLVAITIFALVVGLRLTVMGGHSNEPARSHTDSSASGVAPAVAADVAPPGWVRFEDDVFEGWIHPDWIVGNLDLTVFATDEAVADLSPLVRQAVKQNGDFLKETTVIWVKLNIERGGSAIQIHGCLGPAGALGNVVTPDMIVEVYETLGMRASPVGISRFGDGHVPMVRMVDQPADTEVLQAMLMGKDCFTTAEFIAPSGDADSMRLFESFIENLRFKN